MSSSTSRAGHVDLDSLHAHDPRVRPFLNFFMYRALRTMQFILQCGIFRDASGELMQPRLVVNGRPVFSILQCITAWMCGNDRHSTVPYIVFMFLNYCSCPSAKYYLCKHVAFVRAIYCIKTWGKYLFWDPEMLAYVNHKYAGAPPPPPAASRTAALLPATTSRDVRMDTATRNVVVLQQAQYLLRELNDFIVAHSSPSAPLNTGSHPRAWESAATALEEARLLLAKARTADRRAPPPSATLERAASTVTQVNSVQATLHATPSTVAACLLAVPAAASGASSVPASLQLQAAPASLPVSHASASTSLSSSSRLFTSSSAQPSVSQAVASLLPSSAAPVTGPSDSMAALMLLALESSVPTSTTASDAALQAAAITALQRGTTASAGALPVALRGASGASASAVGAATGPSATACSAATAVADVHAGSSAAAAAGQAAAATGGSKRTWSEMSSSSASLPSSTTSSSALSLGTAPGPVSAHQGATGSAGPAVGRNLRRRT